MTEQENKTWAIDVLTAALRKLESGELKAQSCHVSVDSGSITDSTGTTTPFPNGIVTYTLTATDVKMARNFEIRGQAPGIKHVEQSIDKSELLDAVYLDDGGGE